MKIGIFTDSYKPYTSGVVTSISNFKEELTLLGHEIHIFAPSYPNYEEVEETLNKLLENNSPGKIAGNYVSQNSGATDIIINQLKKNI